MYHNMIKHLYKGAANNAYHSRHGKWYTSDNSVLQHIYIRTSLIKAVMRKACPRYYVVKFPATIYSGFRQGCILWPSSVFIPNLLYRPPTASFTLPTRMPEQPWWLSMMTSSNGSIFRVTGHLCGEFTGPGEFPAQRPVTRSFDVFFRICAWMNDWVNNREAGDLRRHCGHYDVTVMPKISLEHQMVKLR